MWNNPILLKGTVPLLFETDSSVILYSVDDVVVDGAGISERIDIHKTLDQRPQYL